MNLCSENHDEIVYEGGRYVKCPLCEAICIDCHRKTDTWGHRTNIKSKN